MYEERKIYLRQILFLIGTNLFTDNHAHLSPLHLLELFVSVDVQLVPGELKHKVQHLWGKNLKW